MKMRPSSLLVACTAGALALGSSSGVAHAEQSRSAAAKPPITIKVKKAEIKLGKRVVVTGKVRKNRKKITRVKLQQKRPGKKWRTQTTAKVNRKGKFRLRERPTTATQRKYRVVSVTGPRRRSPKATVKVFTWVDVTKLERNKRDLFVKWVNPVRIGTVPYAPSYVGSTWGATGLVDFNLAPRRCTRLRARYGLGDRSDLTASTQLTATADNVVVHSGTYRFGESQRRRVDIDQPFRIGFRFVADNPTPDEHGRPGAESVIAEPEVYCTRK